MGGPCERCSLLAGLVLSSGFPSAPPPINSLPCLWCPRRLARTDPETSPNPSLLGLGDLSGVVMLPGAKVKAGNGAGLAERLTRCWLAAISSRIGCFGLGVATCGSSAPGLNENSGNGSGFGALREAVAACISSGTAGLGSLSSFSTPSESAPGLNENAGKGGALGLREYALEYFRLWPVEVEGLWEEIESKGEPTGITGGIDTEVMVGKNYERNRKRCLSAQQLRLEGRTRFPAPWDSVIGSKSNSGRHDK